MNLLQRSRWAPLLPPLALALALHHAARHAAEPAPQRGPRPLLVRAAPTPAHALSKALPEATAQRELDQRELNERLMSACRANDFRAARTLLHCGADPNGRYEDGMPLFFDFLNGSDSSQNRALRFLLEHGANANGSPQGWRPLMWAAFMNGDKEAVELLLAHGARIDGRDKIGQTALAASANICGGCGCSSNASVGIALIKHGADVNAANSEGNTPLLLLLGTDDINMKFTRALLGHGADVRHRNKKGEDALRLANRSAAIYPEIFHLLQKAARQGGTRNR